MNADVFERNVARLLKRAYVPALPAPDFRTRLERLFALEVRRRARARGTVRALPRPARLAVALAAGILALLLGWSLLSREERAGRAELLAHGQVALGVPDGTGGSGGCLWRAASAEELAEGVDFVAPGLIAVTPASVSISIHAGESEVLLAESSELVLEERAGGIYARLAHGSASASGPSGPLDLAPGSEVNLRPEIAPAPAGIVGLSPRDGRSDRQPVPSGSAPPAPPAADEAQGGRFLAGVVVDGASQLPVRRFTVALLRERIGNETYPPERRDFESAEGAFRWEDPPAGKQRVFVHADGFALALLGELDLAQPAPPLRAELVPGASVRGSVLDPAENPVEGALVLSEMEVPADGLFLEDTERSFWLPIQARTGPDGRFELAHLNAGEHTMRVTAEGHAPTWVAGVRVPAAPASPGEELAIELAPGGAVEGRVTRGDGSPWVGAQIVIVAMDQVRRPITNFTLRHTDAEGFYRAEHMPPATMIVVLERGDEPPEVKPVEVRAGETARADFATEREGVRLSGRVLDPRGNPFALQNLGLFDKELARWNQNWVATTTLTDGSYTFEGVKPGAYLIFLIDRMGRGLRCVDELELPDLPVVEHDVRVGGGAIQGTVRDGRSGGPLPSAVVMLVREEAGGECSFAAHGTSDGHGVFSFTDLQPGVYVATAYPTREGLGFARSEPLALVEAGTQASTEIWLFEGGEVDVVVRDPEGRPLPDALIFFVDDEGAEHAFSQVPETDENGRYRAYGLRPGYYRALAFIEGHKGAPVSFQYELGAELEVNIVLAPATLPSGR